MKKAAVTLLFLTVGWTASFANDPAAIDPRIVSAFQKEFSFAQNVKWEMNGDMAKVNFSLNDQVVVALYSAQAELLLTARSIQYMQLPISVIKSLEQNYSKADLLTFTEYNSKGETFYHIEMEKNNKKFLLKATPFGDITIVKKIK